MQKLYDLHINSMTYTLFFIPDYQFQKVFLFLWVVSFLLFFVEAPYLWRPWATAQFAPSYPALLGTFEILIIIIIIFESTRRRIGQCVSFSFTEIVLTAVFDVDRTLRGRVNQNDNRGQR